MKIDFSTRIAAAAAAGLISAACGGSQAEADTPEAGETAGEMGDKAECKGEEGCGGEGADKADCKGEEGCQGEGEAKAECKGEEGCEGHAPQ